MVEVSISLLGQNSMKVFSFVHQNIIIIRSVFHLKTLVVATKSAFNSAFFFQAMVKIETPSTALISCEGPFPITLVLDSRSYFKPGEKKLSLFFTLHFKATTSSRVGEGKQ